MYSPLVALYHSSQPSPSPSPISFLVLPLPDTQLSDLHLGLISTYFIHLLLVLSHTTIDLASLSSTLLDASSPTLLAWAPLFSRLPEKQHDHLFTRAYTVASRLTSSNPPASTAYSLRIFALLCLAHTRPSVVPANTFWEQAVKFAGAFANTTSTNAQENAKSVSDTFARLVLCAATRPDASEFFSGPAFARFCEYWSRFAKQVSRLADQRE